MTGNILQAKWILSKIDSLLIFSVKSGLRRRYSRKYFHRLQDERLEMRSPYSRDSVGYMS